MFKLSTRKSVRNVVQLEPDECAPELCHRTKPPSQGDARSLRDWLLLPMPRVPKIPQPHQRYGTKTTSRPHTLSAARMAGELSLPSSETIVPPEIMDFILKSSSVPYIVKCMIELARQRLYQKDSRRTDRCMVPIMMSMLDPSTFPAVRRDEYSFFTWIRKAQPRQTPNANKNK
jgi:hypothetical protein